MNIEIDDDDAKALARLYLESGKYKMEEGQALQRLCQQVRDKLPRPVKKGDIVHVPNGTYERTTRMQVVAIDKDRRGNSVVWCRDKDGNFGTWDSADLAHGVRPRPGN